MKISKYGNVRYGYVFENHYHILTFKYGSKKTVELKLDRRPSQKNVPLWSKIVAPVVAVFWLFGRRLVYSRGRVSSEGPSVSLIFYVFFKEKHIEIFNFTMSFNKILRTHFLYNT